MIASLQEQSIPSDGFIEKFIRERIAILCDDSAGSFRAALVSPAKNMDRDTVNRMITLSSGILCVALDSARVQAFMLAPMSRPRMTPSGRPATGSGDTSSGAAICFCESVEAREGVTTGISTADRALTISILGEETPVPRKLVKPGHIFPVEVRPGGVLVRNAIPEGSLDIVRMAGFTEAAAFVDLLNERGEFLDKFSTEQLAIAENLPMLTLSQLIRIRLQTESLVYKVAEARLPTRLAGELRSVIYKSKVHEGENLALIKGEIDGDAPVLTRVQMEFAFGDVFGGNNPPTRLQIQRSMKAIGERGRGVLLYLRRPAAGQLEEQVSSWETTFKQRSPSTLREYGLGAQILRDLGVRRVELLTGSKVDMQGLGYFGLEIVSQNQIPE